MGLRSAFLTSKLSCDYFILKLIVSIACLLSPLFCISALAQPGGYDPDFAVGALTLNGQVATIHAVEIIGDSVLVAGDFDTINGVPQTGLVLLNSVGAVDQTFSFAGGPNAAVKEMLLLENGQIIIAGEFTAYNGVVRNRLARLNPDGSLDTSFNPQAGPNGPVFAVCQQGDRILIGGAFTSVNGVTRNRIARLNADGTLDNSFNPGLGANGNVYAIETEDETWSWSDIFIGGIFTQFDGNSASRLARLDGSGSFRNNYTSGTGFDGPVYTIHFDRYSQGGDYLYVGGAFTSIDGLIRNRLTRFDRRDYNGGPDSSFGVFLNGDVREIRAGMNDRIIISGDFSNINGFGKNNVARLMLNYDDTVEIDLDYNPDPGPNGSVTTFAQLSDGRLVIGGAFTRVGENSTSGLARLYWDYESSLPGDATSLTATPASHERIFLDWSTPPDASSVSVERSLNGATDWEQISTNGSPKSDGPLASSTQYFYRYRGQNYNGYGSYSNVVSAFTEGEAWTGPGASLPLAIKPNGRIYALAKQENGKILIGGDFTSIDGVIRNRIARLNEDLSVDTSFTPLGGANSTIRAITIQTDGQILFAGSFSDFNGQNLNRIARVNPDGSLDETFDAGNGPNSTVYAIHQNQNGTILICGDFSSVDGQSKERIARLLPDGTLDSSYLASSEWGRAERIIPQSSDKVILVGPFDRVNGIEQRSIARLNADGTLDVTFNADPGADDINDIALSPDGSFIICGSFSRYNEIPRNRVAKIDANGNLVDSWQLDEMPNSTVESVAVDSDGRIIIGGSFTKIGNTLQPRLARLNQDGTLDWTFRIGTGFNSTVKKLFLLNIDESLVSGDFSDFNGKPTANLALVKIGPVGQPYITSQSPFATAALGIAYSENMEALGGQTPYTWRVSGGILPLGLQLTPSGVLGGIPNRPGDNSFLIEVQDADGDTHEKLIRLEVRDPTLSPIIVEATYGADGVYADVSDIVTAQLNSGNNVISASNSAMGEDPIFGVVKTLSVKYRLGTGVYITTAREGSSLTIPDESHSRVKLTWADWREIMFTPNELTNTTISSYDSDPDVDGFSNLFEYAFGGQPHIRDAYHIAPRVEFVDGLPTLGFWCDSDRTGITYSVEASNRLLPNTWQEIAISDLNGAIQPGNEESTTSDPATGYRFVTVTKIEQPEGKKLFYRVNIQID
jgi:uncharacterized delta-60 repeat protein